MWEKPREFRARAIRKSIYYVEMDKIVILGLDQQFSSTNKDFFVHRHLQKKFCSFFFLTLSYAGGASDHPLRNRGRLITHLPMMPGSARTIFS